MRKGRLKKQKSAIDRKIFYLTLGLTLLGLVAVADASAPQALAVFSDRFYFVKQQAVWGALGILGLLFASRLHYSFWEKIATPLFFASLVLLVIVLIPSIGTRALGARRWLVFGAISFQPSEFAKLAIAIYMAKIAAKDKKVLAFFIPLGLVAALIMAQPDLGTAMVVVAISLAQVFVAGLNLFHLLGFFLAGGLVSLAYILISGYRRDRLLTFLEITRDPLGKSYHIRQVLLALGSGGLFGVGLGQSRQKYLFLPEAATDSIFAIVAEEIGFFGATALIFLFAWLVFRGLKVVTGAPDKFSQILSVGIVTWIGGQAFLNIASMVALVPLTGVPFPFFSYGGSSLTMNLIAIGILLSISRYATKG